jgi:hypothetical protein
MSDQLAALNAALDQARSAAGAAVPAIPATGSNVVPMQAPNPGRPVSMREMVAEGGMSVKAYLKVDKAGFTLGADTSTYHKEFEVEFRLNQAMPFYGVRFGNPAKYLKSMDRIVEKNSRRSWADVVAEAGRLDPRCKGDYRAVDLPFTSVKDIKSGEVSVEAGETLGWTSSITNWKAWEEFVKPYFVMMDAGTLNEDALVRGRIVHTQKKDGQNVWGILTFEDFSIADVGTAQAA